MGIGGLLAREDSIAPSKDRLYMDPGDIVPFIVLYGEGELNPGERPNVFYIKKYKKDDTFL